MRTATDKGIRRSELQMRLVAWHVDWCATDASQVSLATAVWSEVPERLVSAAAIAGRAHGGLYVVGRRNDLAIPRRQRIAPLTDKDTIVLGDFINTTGEAVFDDTLKQGLSVQLAQSPFLAQVSPATMSWTLKLMGRSTEDRLTSDIAREVCERVGSTAMLTGSISGLGSQYVIGLRALAGTISGTASQAGRF